MTDVLHVITPGDHYSPRTGSAIPTVVHGLATGARADGGGYVNKVVLQRDTFQPRYDSAGLVEYEGVHAPTRLERYTDGALARLGRTRRGAARHFGPLADRIQREKPGIVIAHNAPVLPWLLRESEHRVVLYAHNDILRSYSRREAGRVLGGVDAFVCVSDSLAEATRAHLPSSIHDRVRVVGNGVDTEMFRPAEEREHGPLRVMFIGRAIPEKGVDILLTAATQVSRSDIEYVVVGSHGFAADAPLSGYERGLRDLARQVPGTVTFSPFVARPELPALLGSADLLVLPSRWPDPCPLTVGEGMAAGVPVLAARMGGIPEALGHAGVLFDPQRPEELAATIAALADDPQRRAELAAAGRARAEQRDWRWAWRNLRTVLDEVA